jgi:hypothetical protein
MKRIFSLLLVSGLLAACLDNQGGMPYNEQDFRHGGPTAPDMNERTMAFMQPGNPYANIEALRPRTEEEKEATTDKWTASRVQTRWQEYKGTMVRVEILLGDSDLREMRLRVIQNAVGGDIDGDLRDIIGRVADFEMRRVCGRRAESIVLVYDRVSFETVRPTPFFDYKVLAEGSSMREYGFRCVYRR